MRLPSGRRPSSGPGVPSCDDDLHRGISGDLNERGYHRRRAPVRHLLWAAGESSKRKPG